MNPSNLSLLTWALRYYDAGWNVMPCENKRPLLPEWEPLQDNRTTRSTVEAWWRKWPQAQIALICGELSGVTVIDIDTPEKCGLTPGEGTMPKDLVHSFGIFPAMVSKTASGGRHIFCKFSNVKNSAKLVHPQVDIKSAGGYVILPPSLGQAGFYEWTSYYPFDEENVSQLPWFPDAFKELSEKPQDDPEWGKIAMGAVQGSRNITATRLAGKLIKAFRDEESAAWQLLSAWNTHFNKPPLPQEELKGTFLSILKSDLGGRINPAL